MRINRSASIALLLAAPAIAAAQIAYVDAHVHPLSGSLEEALQVMSQSGIRAMVLMPLRSSPACAGSGTMRNSCARFASIKHPKHVVFLESLPKNAMGKVQKFELRRLVIGR